MHSVSRIRCDIRVLSKFPACEPGRGSRMPPTFRPRRHPAIHQPTSEEGKTRRAPTLTDRKFALASASLRQALDDMPELTEMSKHIMIEETKQGLKNIELIDQNGRSIADGSKEPYERTCRIVQRLAGPLKRLPYRISITGHTAATKLPASANHGPW